jgi:molecular chaperone DnaK
VERVLRELGERVPASVSSDVEQAIGRLRAALQGAASGVIRQAAKDLRKKAQQIGEVIYTSNAGNGRLPSHGATGERDSHQQQDGDSAIDAQFREL